MCSVCHRSEQNTQNYFQQDHLSGPSGNHRHLLAVRQGWVSKSRAKGQALGGEGARLECGWKGSFTFIHPLWGFLCPSNVPPFHTLPTCKTPMQSLAHRGVSHAGFSPWLFLTCPGLALPASLEADLPAQSIYIFIQPAHPLDSLPRFNAFCLCFSLQ